MGQLRRFLGIFVSLFIIAIAGNAHSAGYTCDSIKQYTSCNAGYYISDCGTKRDGSSVSSSGLTVGNKCETCPTGYNCSGDLQCPAPLCVAITLNNTQNGGTDGTTTVYKKYGSTTLYRNNTCTMEIVLLYPTKTNATFVGYYDTSTATGGTRCINASGTWSSSCNPTSATTYYAQYGCNENYRGSGTRIAGTCTASTYTITLNDNNGSGGTGTAKEVYATKWTNSAGTTITSVTAPSPRG